MNAYRIGRGAGGWRLALPSTAAVRWRAWVLAGCAALALAGLLLGFIDTVQVSMRQGAVARAAEGARVDELRRCSSLAAAALRSACRRPLIDVPG
ncbi:MAG: hypothetical protein KGK09_03110 [Burkholderiales bacterium]|nr:hypothetical protein [Burkholderiales bacterium]